MPFVARDYRLEIEKRPLVMSVLNVTPDSFSDGGQFLTASNLTIDYDAVVASAECMVKDGADMIDVGGESTRPGAVAVSADEEIRRTAPVIERLVKKISVPVSIDTTKAAVAEAALKAGASIVNDISGFRFDAGIAAVCARYRAAAVLMHLRQKPTEMMWSVSDTTEYLDLVEEVKSYLAASLQQAAAAGVEHCIIDVGFGFGKSVAGNYELLRRLDEFKSLGRPILAGLSRKSFIGKAIASGDGHFAASEVAPVSERLSGTIAANVIALINGANILRVHDTQAARDAVRIFQATYSGIQREA